MKTNILESLLGQMKVKFTKNYTRKFFNEYPERKSLFGISQMLSDYNIPSTAIRMKDKNEVRSLETPFVVNIEGDMVSVKKIKENKVFYVKNGINREILIDDFQKMWDGVMLIPEKKEDSIEPNYKENLKKQIYHIFREKLVVISIISLFLVGLITNSLYLNPALLILSAVNLAGVYVGYLLIQKQLYIQNNHADKICSLFKKNGCNDVLNSPAAKFMGIIGWSEIGFSYFISNTLITVLFPQLISYLVLINICALPYSFWSVSYQRFKAKQWCPLCLGVQILFWFIFIISLTSGFISVPLFTITDILFTAIIYTIPFLAISMLLPKIMSEKELLFMKENLHQLRMKPEVFETLLKQQPYYNVDKSTSQITFGNKDADMLVSIVTNPHCPPCASMHRDIEKLLKKAGDSICVQYIFFSYTSENDDLEYSNRILTAAYLSDSSMEDKISVYNEWFGKGKNDREAFRKKYNLELSNQTVIEEVNKHKAWKEKTDINATPTVLINGYELPYNYYQIEDIIYFTGLKI